jgi:ribose/xylose/arabinose/galactoside ABC-type transport system permease subunit
MLSKKKLSSFSTLIGFLSLIVIFFVFGALNSGFLKATNITNIFVDISPLLIMGTGVTFIIMLGSTDLSIGAVCSLASVLFVRYAETLGIWTYVLVIGFGLVSGCIVGILNAYFKVPSFIASLGLMSILQSLSLVFSNSGTIQLSPKQWYLIDWMSEKLSIIPVIFIVAIGISFIYLYIQTRTSFGKKVFSIGANERAAYMVGLPCTSTKIWVFIFAGACYALAGIMFVAKMASGSPNMGDNYTLLSIASVALGGTSLSGGRGSIIKTLIGVGIVIVVRNGMTVAGIDSFWQKIVYGGIIIIAAYITSDRSNKSQIVK